MLTKILFAACAIFVVAQATDIYFANWGVGSWQDGTWYNSTCNTTSEPVSTRSASLWWNSAKFTLDLCTIASGNGVFHSRGGSQRDAKVSLSGSTYTMVLYESDDKTCTTPTQTASGPADTCVNSLSTTAEGRRRRRSTSILYPVSRNVKFLPTATGYLSESNSDSDCTSSKCTDANSPTYSPPTPPPTPNSAPTAAPTDASTTVSQGITINGLESSDYTAAVQALYEKGYGQAVGACTSPCTSYNIGVSITSSATGTGAAIVTFVMTLSPGVAATYTSGCSGTCTTTTLETALRAYVTTGATITVDTMATASVTTAAPTVSGNPATSAAISVFLGVVCTLLNLMFC